MRPDDSDYLPNDPRRPIPAGDDFMELFGAGGGRDFEPVEDDDPPSVDSGELRSAVETSREDRDASRSDQPGKGRSEKRPANSRGARTAQNSESTRRKPSDSNRQQPSKASPARGSAPSRPPAKSTAIDKASESSQEPTPRSATPSAAKPKSNWERLAAMLGLRGSQPEATVAESTAEPAETKSAIDISNPDEPAGAIETESSAEILESLFVASGKTFDDPESQDSSSRIGLEGANQELNTAVDSDDDFVEFAIEELDPQARESGGFGRDDADADSEEAPAKRRRRRGRRGRGRKDNSVDATREPSAEPSSREPDDESDRPRHRRDRAPRDSARPEKRGPKRERSDDSSRQHRKPSRPVSNVENGDDFVEFGDDSDRDSPEKRITTWVEVIGSIVDSNMKSRRPGRSHSRSRRGEGRGENRHEGRGDSRREERGESGRR